MKVAEKSNITVRSYQRIEQGLQEPKIFTALLIAEALGIENVKEIFPLPTTIEREKEPNTDSTNTNTVPK